MADDYFENLDRYLAPQEQNRFLDGGSVGEEGAPNLSKPIVPIGKLGTTFAEKGPSGQGTVLQSMIASIRRGTGQLQLAMQTGVNAQMGGGVSSIGKDQRQAIKEVLKASEVKWEGLELSPQDMSNMSGYDPQRGGFSEEKRKKDIRHVKDAIVFAAEIGAGGGVDIWSQEFYRNIHDASFQKDGGQQFQDFEGFDENKHAMKTLVDDRTGQAIQFQTGGLGGQNNPEISVPKWVTAHERGVGPDGTPYEPGDYLDAEGNKLVADANDKNFVMKRVPVWNEEESRFESQRMKWTDFKKYAQERNEAENVDLTPEEWWHRVQLENQYAQQRGQAVYYSQRYTKERDELKELVRARDEYKRIEEGKSEDELRNSGMMVPQQNVTTSGSQLIPQSKFVKKSELIQESINELKQRMLHTHEASGMADAQAETVWSNIEHIKTAEEYALEKTTDSYSDAALFALEQTNKHAPQSPIYVGPELGWPQGYGGHTDEFINIIETSRQKMLEKMKADPRFQNHDEQQLKEMAKKHISGVLDTSHLSMWYNHFPKKEPTESEESRLKRFNKWYLEQMDKLAKHDVVGSVQIVDSATGDHRHLPVGQGIFPTAEAVKRLHKGGFKGGVVSEGHEDENVDPGSTQYSLWNEFGASIGTGYHFGLAPGGGNAFGNVYGGIGGAAGYRAPPNYIFGAYSPSNEWKTWTEHDLW